MEVMRLMEPRQNPHQFYGKMPEENPLGEFKASKQSLPDELTALSRSLADISSGLRILEDRYSNLRKKSQLTDQALLDSQKNFQKEKRVLREELMEAKLKVQDLIDDLALMRSELRDAVKQRDLKAIEKYLDMWEPMEFVTRKEAEQLIEEKLGSKDTGKALNTNQPKGKSKGNA